MDPVWIAIAFVPRFLVKQVGLPPLVGFLVEAGTGLAEHAYEAVAGTNRNAGSA
jgi:predicted Kef-type K+ transport protein